MIREHKRRLRDTPYAEHAVRPCAPTMTRYSPNGIDIIEECDCGARFLHNPCIGVPITLDNANKKGQIR